MCLWFRRPKLVKVISCEAPVPPGELVEVEFAEEVIDRGGFFDPAAPTRITIPSGLGGWYLLLCTIRWTLGHGVPQPDPVDEAQYFFYSYVRRNGDILSNGARQVSNRTTNSHGTWQVMATEEALTSGDVLDVAVRHCFPATYISYLNAQCHLSLRRIAGVRLRSRHFTAETLSEDQPMPE